MFDGVVVAVGMGVDEGVIVAVDDGLGEGGGGSAATQAVRISKVMRISKRFM